MAYITKGKARTWEIRESAATRRGPRSRTLATFRELDDGVLAQASSRASKPLDAGGLRRAALRKGTPVAEPPIISATRIVLAEISRGERLPPALADLLADAVGTPRARPSAAARAAGEWLDADPRRRGEALEDLLLLTDRIPAPGRRRELRFPRLKTKPA